MMTLSCQWNLPDMLAIGSEKSIRAIEMEFCRCKGRELFVFLQAFWGLLVYWFISLLVYWFRRSLIG